MTDSDDDIEKLVESSLELIEFVEELNQGKFYAKRLTELLKRDDVASFWELTAEDPAMEVRHRQANSEYRRKLLTNRQSAQQLLVELLRFQNWSNGA